MAQLGGDTLVVEQGAGGCEKIPATRDALALPLPYHFPSRIGDDESPLAQDGELSARLRYTTRFSAELP